MRMPSGYGNGGLSLLYGCSVKHKTEQQLAGVYHESKLPVSLRGNVEGEDTPSVQSAALSILAMLRNPRFRTKYSR